MAVSLQTICLAALQRIGVIAAGEVPQQHDLQLALDRLNALIDSWRTSHLFERAIRETAAVIAPGVGTYTVGPGGDFDVLLPVYLERVILEQQTTVPPTRLPPLARLSDADRAAWPQPALTGSLPTHWYYELDINAPFGTLEIYPVPTSGGDRLLLQMPQPVGPYLQFDLLELQPGYQQFFQEQLAVQLAPDFEREPSPVLMRSAQRAEAAIRTPNTRMRDLPLLTPFSNGSSYDINSDSGG